MLKNVDGGQPWNSFRVSVDEIERKKLYYLLANVLEALQSPIEGQDW
ncbi:hypothetical protein [Larkinella sp. C7]|jgi:DNA/RNA endonuclease G (NUC1)|nr:hypothetical protein [Larkinella sp. C7]